MKNRLLMIASLFLLIILGGSTMFAQRSNSAVQMVTFGVSRSQVASINVAPLANHSSSTRFLSPATKLVGKSAEMPLKITYSNVSSGTVEKSHSDLASKGSSIGNSSSFRQSTEPASRSTIPLIVTITE